MDITAPKSGVITEYFHGEGDTVDVGADFYILDTDAKGGAAAPPKAAPKAEPAAAAPPKAAPEPAKAAPEPPKAAPPPPVTP